MNLDISSVLEKAQAHLISWLLPLIGTATLGGVLWAEDRLALLVSDPTDIWLIRTIAVSVLLLFLLAGSWFYYRPKFKPTIWGAHENIKTGAYFCSTCLIPNKVHSPMYLSSDGRYWKCHSNNNHIKLNPEFHEPPEPPKPKLDPRTAWMAR